jgi:hypothetical protein
MQVDEARIKREYSHDLFDDDIAAARGQLDIDDRSTKQRRPSRVVYQPARHRDDQFDFVHGAGGTTRL